MISDIQRKLMEKESYTKDLLKLYDKHLKLASELERELLQRIKEVEYFSKR